MQNRASSHHSVLLPRPVRAISPLVSCPSCFHPCCPVLSSLHSGQAALVHVSVRSRLPSEGNSLTDPVHSKHKALHDQHLPAKGSFDFTTYNSPPMHAQCTSATGAFPASGSWHRLVPLPGCSSCRPPPSPRLATPHSHMAKALIPFGSLFLFHLFKITFPVLIPNG